MPKQEDFGRLEKSLEKTREIDNKARISKKAEIKRKSNRNQKRVTLRDIQLSSLTSLLIPDNLEKFSDLPEILKFTNTIREVAICHNETHIYHFH